MNLKKLLILVVVAALIAAFIAFDGAQYISVGRFQEWVSQNPFAAASAYFGLYVLIAALSLPGAAAITLLGGAVFGLVWGTLLVSFASTIGATIAFLLSRTLFADTVNKKFSKYTNTINNGVEKEGAFYLFSIRMIPVVPFFVVNLVFGLTKMKTFTFYWVSQLGMLIGTAVYVNAGAQLGAVDELSVSGVFTPSIIGAFVLLAILPFIARGLVNMWKTHQVYKGYTKPKKFDVNMVAIGAGSGGLVSAYIAAAVKAKVVLIEKHKMGGDCLNTGCVPSKALIRAAKTQHYIETADQLGIENASSKVNFEKVMGRVHNVIDTIEPHDSVERYTELGVECVKGEAKILSPWEVQVGERVITTKNIVIASGARPFVPPIPGIEDVDYLTSDSLWEIKELPKRLLVLGTGPIGSELAQAFNRIGSEVTVVDRNSRPMAREDEDVSEYILETFEKEGINVILNHVVMGFRKSDDGFIAEIEAKDGSKKDIVFDKVMVAVGRQARTEGFGLEDLGIDITQRGTIQVDEYLRTKFPNIYAVGDVAGPYQFTHTAAHQAWYASVNALFGVVKKFKVDYRVIPWVTFTDPEVARVGLSESDAKAKNIDVDVTKFGIDDLDRAIADNEAKGFIKVLTAKGNDKILGCTIVGAHGGDLLAEYVLAMKHNIGLNKILGTIHSYPTMSEANKYVAGEWKRANVSPKTMSWLEKFHSWRR